MSTELAAPTPSTQAGAALPPNTVVANVHTPDAPQPWQQRMLTGDYESYATSPVLTKYQTEQEALKGLVHLNEKVGGMISLPKPDAKPEERAEFFKKLGVPEAPDAYALPEIKLPEGLQVDTAAQAQFKQWAHEANLTPDQTAQLYQKYMEGQGASFQQSQAALQQSFEQTSRELRTEWGKDYDQRVNAANFVIQNNMSPALVELFKNNPALANNTEVVKFLSSVGMRLADQSTITTGSTATGRLHPTQALAQIEQLNGDVNFMKRYYAQEESAKKQMDALFAAAYPEQSNKNTI